MVYEWCEQCQAIGPRHDHLFSKQFDRPIRAGVIPVPEKTAAEKLDRAVEILKRGQ